MREAWLIRDSFSDQRVAGRLILGDEVLHTLEKPWLGNLIEKSCIPSGRYLVKHLPSSYSGKYQDVYHLDHVDGRTGILIHKGNLVSHTLGCILIGLRAGSLNNEPAVLASAPALTQLHRWAEREAFMLSVVSYKQFVLDGALDV
tara:strand:+ start:11 stop:445 length:435 start_codon:yes stop_codon:yes gene_type:complete